LPKSDASDGPIESRITHGRPTFKSPSDKIEMVLAAHRSPARVWGGRLTPRTNPVSPSPRANTKLIRLQNPQRGSGTGTRRAKHALTRSEGLALAAKSRAAIPILVSLMNLSRKASSGREPFPRVDGPRHCDLGCRHGGHASTPSTFIPRRCPLPYCRDDRFWQNRVGADDYRLACHASKTSRSPNSALRPEIPRACAIIGHLRICFSNCQRFP